MTTPATQPRDLLQPHEHVPKKCMRFFDKNMLEIVLERILITWVVTPKWKAL